MRERHPIKLSRCCKAFEPELAVDSYGAIEIKCPKCGRRVVVQHCGIKTAVDLWNKNVEEENEQKIS